MKKIKTALISVFHKEGLDEVVELLKAQGVTIYSTGGTAGYIQDLGGQVNEVADLTAYPSIFGGRVKTLHPKIFGGILARRDDITHQEEAETYQIPMIDLVIVDLYPFEATVASGAEEALIIEKIDIGGISLIRAAAKNFRDVAIVPGQEYYGELARLLREQNGALSLEQRKWLAGEAFDISSHYDIQIHRYLSPESLSLKVSERRNETLRYGENPHQTARFYGKPEHQFEQLAGKALSYNNLVDIDAAFQVIDEFNNTAFAVIKHTNTCGLALGENILDAWQKALAGDPVSAFGGVLCTNTEIDTKTAEEIDKIFFEVLIAPGFSAGAKEILQKKKNRILLKRTGTQLPKQILKTAINGYLVQDKDLSLCLPEAYEIKSSRQPSDAENKDIQFAEISVKHLKSNGIAIVKNGQLIGMGAGQTSRIDALRQAIDKAKAMGFSLKGAVLSSDAFFPFSDCAELSNEAGIEILVQPGGSIRDQDTIDYCESRNMCLIFTGIRHFKH